MIQLRFLGTGAADFHPDLDRPEGLMTSSLAYRRSTSTLLNGRVLLDCGPHTPACFALHGEDMAKVSHVFFTHLHSDHYQESSLRDLAAAASRTLHVYYRADGELPDIPGVEYHPLVPGETVTAAGLSFTALEANHTAHPLHYSIEGENGRLFYGLDGAWLLYDTYYAMKDKHYNMMVLDCTVGDYEGDFRMAEHNSLPMIRMMEQSFRTVGIADAHTAIVLDHLARTLHPSHAELCRNVEKDGYIVAYDGLCLDCEGKA